MGKSPLGDDPLKLPHHLYRHPLGVWYFQLAIPRSLRTHFSGKRWVRYSLQTREPLEAKLKAYSHTAYWHNQFREITLVSKPKVDEILANPDKTDFTLGKAKGNWMIKEAKDTADYELGLREIGRLNSLGIKPEPTLAPIQKNEFVPKHKTTIQEAVMRFIDEIKSSTIKKTLKTKQNALFEFKQFLGAKTLVHTLGKKELGDFKIHLLKKNELRTVSNKFIYVGQLFDSLKASGLYLMDNPAIGQVKYSKKQKQKDTALNKYLPFTSAEIQTIFLTENIGKVANPHLFWGSLIAYFTGARVNEICQLLVADIDTKNLTIHFNVSTDEQSLKSPHSNRTIPIHETLIDIGFLDYVNGVDKKEHFKLFPYLKKTQNGFGDRLSKDFATYLKKLGLKKKRKCFHSFRSTINNKLLKNNVPVDYRSVFLGQSIESVNLDHYSEKYSSGSLAEMCFKLFVVDFDVAGLKKLDKKRFIDYV